jgi:hypothetical protein
MLASFPASMLNQNQSDLEILNRFNLTPSRSSARISCEHVTIWQSSRNTVSWRKAGVVAPAENESFGVSQRPTTQKADKMLIFQYY